MTAEQYQPLYDRAAPARADATLSLPPDLGSDALTAWLQEIFLADATLEHVALSLGDEVLGVTSRELVRRRSRHLPQRGGDDWAVGTADGLTLPGSSTGYALLRYRCRVPGCPRQAFLLLHQPGREPACPQPGHPAMAYAG